MPFKINYSFKVLFIVSVLIYMSASNQIVDFQYTQYSQNINQNSLNRANFNFEPQQIPNSKLQYPQACELIDELNKPLQQNQKQISGSNIDAYLNSMKQKFLSLLTLTQKLSNSQQKILHFERLINQTNPSPPQQSKLNQISNLQNKLSSFTTNITIKNNQLKGILSTVQANSNNYHLSQSKRIELDYIIDALKQKLNYLQNFQQKAKLAHSRTPIDVDYNTYFDDLERQFNNQSALIQNIDLIIQKKDRLNQLRQTKANKQSSIAALDLYIQDIKLCNRQKQNIRNQFKNHQKINQLITQLKRLKNNEQPNIYCEGVVKKLTEKIISMLRYYDIVASCASDLQPKIEILTRQKQQLKQIDQQIAKLEAISNLQDFQRTYQNQKLTIENMYDKIKEWKMKQFVHDREKIRQLKHQTKNQLQRAQQQRKALNLPHRSNQLQPQNLIPAQIIVLINEIKDLKLKYCGIYHKYDSLANQLWTDIYKYESQINLKNKLYKMYNQERLNYEQMYKELIELRRQIYENLG